METEGRRRETVEQLAEEFVERYRRGERPPLSEYTRRHPEHASEIRELFPALVVMEQIAPDSDESEASSSLATRGAGLPRLPERLGDYRILRQVGRGGMGVVYEAQQLSLGRHVAIKVLPSHALLDPRQLGRFQREARSAARLHHTNIVPVFGVGEQDGLHYYVMQFIQGLGLDLVLDELRRLRLPRGQQALPRGDTPDRRSPGSRDVSAVAVARALLSGEFRHPASSGALKTAPGGPAAGAELGASSSVRAADPSVTVHLLGQTEGSTLNASGHCYWQSVARVGVQVADALAHAASQGVLHRDIKPANLLLDNTGNVWVTDFGLAKADSDFDNLTRTGDVVGTLRYMAPERFSGKGDLRSDVYSLGLTLYELLALRPAFDEADRNKLVKQVLHDEPLRPSKLNRGVPRDLETIVLKAIARDPAHRYQTPAEMADDLKRFVEDRPVRARRIGEAERLWRWCRRNPLPASLLAGIVLVFLAGFAGVSWQWREARRREGQAVAARDDAKRTQNAAARQAAGLLFDRGIEDVRGGEPARALHLFVKALRIFPAEDPETAPLERVIRANLSAWAEAVPALEHVWPSAVRLVNNVAFSPDGEAIALATGKDAVQCFRTDTGRPVGPPAEIPEGVGQAMAFAPDGRSLWVASPGTARVVERWNLHRLDPTSGRRSSRRFRPPGRSTALMSPPSPALRTGGTSSGQSSVCTRMTTAPGRTRDGTRTWRTASIIVWEAASGRVVRKVDVNSERPFAPTFLGLSPDGKSVTAWVCRGSRYEGLTFGVDGTEPPKKLGLYPGNTATASIGDSWETDFPTLQFQNNLRTALTVKDGQVHRWSITNPSVLGPGVPAPFRCMHDGPSPDGRSVISPVEGRVFDTGAWPPRPSGVRFAHPGWAPYSKEQYSPDGRFIATWHLLGDSDRRLWRLSRPHSRPPLPPTEWARQPERGDYFTDAQFDLRGARAVIWMHQQDRHRRKEEVNNVRIVDVATGAARDTSVRHSAMVRDVAFAPDGRYFATASFDASARVWEAATGRPAGPPLRHANYVATVAFSPDGKTLAAGDYGPAGLIRLWDWRTGKEVRAPLSHDDIVLHVLFSPDGQYLAALKTLDWSKNPELLIWEVASGRAVLQMRYNHPGYLVREAVRFRPDGRAVAARDANGVLHLLEVPSGQVLGERPLDGDGVTRFSPDGRVVAAAANLGVRLLDGDTLAPLRAGYLPNPDRVHDLAFSPDGASLLTGHESGSAQLWDVATRKPVGPPAVLIGPIRAVSFTPDGKTCLCVAADGTVRRWPVPTPLAEPDLARLADRVALMTGQRMDDNQGLDSVPADEWQSLRAKLVGDGSTDMVAPGPEADWHDVVAADSEQDGDAFGAEWHLDRLAALRPDDWTIPARRGRVLARAGRREEAAAAYAAARSLAPSPRVLSGWCRAAAADDEAAGRYDAGLWDLDRAIEITPDDWVPHAARAALADQAGHPDRVATDEETAIRLGAEASAIVPMADRTASRATRTADWARAVSLGNAAVARAPGLPIDDRYHLAIACWKAGDRAGYRSACAGIAGRMPKAGTPLLLGDAVSASMAFIIGPGATDDWSAPLSWADRVLARIAERVAADASLKEGLRAQRHQFLLFRGALLHRAGRSEEATATLRNALALLPEGGEFSGWLFLALAEHALGRADVANAAAARARAVRRASTIDSAWDRAVVESLAAELDAAVPTPDK